MCSSFVAVLNSLGTALSFPNEFWTATKELADAKRFLRGARAWTKDTASYGLTLAACMERESSAKMGRDYQTSQSRRRAGSHRPIDNQNARPVGTGPTRLTAHEGETT